MPRVQQLIGGEGRNRTGSSPNASLNTLICKGILTLVLQGFKHILTLSDLTRRLHATHPPHTRLLKKSLKVSLKVFASAIFLERKSRVCFHKLMLTVGLKKSPIHGVRLEE